jgi:hypothetical protein
MKMSLERAKGLLLFNGVKYNSKMKSINLYFFMHKIMCYFCSAACQEISEQRAFELLDKKDDNIVVVAKAPGGHQRCYPLLRATAHRKRHNDSYRSSMSAAQHPEADSPSERKICKSPATTIKTMNTKDQRADPNGKKQTATSTEREDPPAAAAAPIQPNKM